MAKIIKRVGIVFFVLVISFLLILGCVFAVNTVKQDSDLGNNVDNNIQPVASKSYNLSGSCAAMYDTWQEAANYSQSNNGALVSLTLKNNWEANPDSSFGTSFGSSIVIEIPQGANMSLNLNGYNVDRMLSKPLSGSSRGYVFNVFGTFTLDDYNISDPAYDKNYKVIPHYGVDYIEGFGQIRGGAQYVANDMYYKASAIYVSGTFNMLGGVICANKFSGDEQYPSGIFGVVLCDIGTFNFENGAIVENYCLDFESGKFGAVASDSGNITLKKGVIFDNQMAGLDGEKGRLTIGGGDLWIYYNNCDYQGLSMRTGLILRDLSNVVFCK